MKTETKAILLGLFTLAVVAVGAVALAYGGGAGTTQPPEPEPESELEPEPEPCVPEQTDWHFDSSTSYRRDYDPDIVYLGLSAQEQIDSRKW